MEQRAIQPRQIAYIVHVKDLLKGKYVKEDGWEPNYVIVGSKNVSRVNIIGVIIDVSDENNFQNMVVDDGTGRISVRNFEKKVDINSGDVVLLVGRIREYGAERFISPEIIKKDVDRKWSLVWKENAVKGSEIDDSEDVEEESLKEIEVQKPKSYIDKIIAKIRELDDGSGASYQEIVKIFKDEKIISELLMQGEIFEIKPGKLKVLY